MNTPMDDLDRESEALISGYLDDELSPEERAAVERRLAESESFREEYEKMKRLVEAAGDLGVDRPPEEVWDTFLDGVYNRAERQTGWLIFIAGAALLACVGVYLFVTEPWGSALIKFLVASPVVGLVVLFISVLRQRLFMAKTDRYSREVRR